MSIPTPTFALMAEDELARFLIDTLRADDVLAGLLFPSYSPPLETRDKRIYSASPELPEDVPFRTALPRITVECQGTGFATEQQAAAPLDGEVAVYIHMLVPKGHEDEVAYIEARIVSLLLSTSLSSVRIIAGGLSYEGQRRKGRVPSFNDAWEVVVQFRSPHVGVIV